MTTATRAPGVYGQDVYVTPAPRFVTGVPVFLGYATAGEVNSPKRLALWSQFEGAFGTAPDAGYLAQAVRGFFENDGLICYVVRLDDAATPINALRNGLDSTRELADVDLLCAPDVMRRSNQTEAAFVDGVKALQRELLDHCQNRRNCFAILDGVPSVNPAGVADQATVRGDFGALYYPWLYLGLDANKQPLYVPPCGHVAGIYSRNDQRVGAHKAPANEPIEGVLDLQVNLTPDAVGELYAWGVNCIQAFPGRGIRVWGARTLSSDPVWRYVNARRVFITITRWLEQFMAGLAHEPNDVRLWVRIMREVSAFLLGMFQSGALQGRTADEAFFVKCDHETNNADVIDAGQVVTHIGLALAAPAEFIEVRVVHGTSGVAVT